LVVAFILAATATVAAPFRQVQRQKKNTYIRKNRRETEDKDAAAK